MSHLLNSGARLYQCRADTHLDVERRKTRMCDLGDDWSENMLFLYFACILSLLKSLASSPKSSRTSAIRRDRTASNGSFLV